LIVPVGLLFILFIYYIDLTLVIIGAEKISAFYFSQKPRKEALLL
jgi:hypothetical protein